MLLSPASGTYKPQDLTHELEPLFMGIQLLVQHWKRVQKQQPIRRIIGPFWDLFTEKYI